MALSTVAQGQVLTSATITSLKAAVKTECQRRRYVGSVVEYAGTNYDYTNSAGSGNLIKEEHYSKNAVPLNAISGNIATNKTNQVITASDINILINKVNDLSTKKIGATTLAATGCAAQCTGLCFGVCSTGCQGCTYTCQDDCNNDCYGWCSGCGDGCHAVCQNTCANECEHGCVGDCDDTCQGCDSICTQQCASWANY